MAGSNGSSAHRGGQDPQNWSPEAEEQARAQAEEYARWQQQQLSQRGYAAQPPGQPQHGYEPQHASVDPHTGFAQSSPNAAPYVSLSDQHGYAESAPVQPVRNDYTPQFERYAPAQQAPRDAYGRYEPVALPGGYPAHQAHDPRTGYEPSQYAPQHDPRSPVGYGQPVPPGYPSGQDFDPRQAQSRADLQSWDLSNYAPGQIPQGYAAHPGAQPFDSRGQPLHQHPAPVGHDAHWQQSGAASPGHWQPQGGPAGHGYDNGLQGHYQPRPGEPGFQSAGEPLDDGYDADDGMALDEKRRGPGTFVIVGALIGAIAVGGGLAYGYKMMGGGLRDKGKPPILKADANPARTAPKDAGGKTIDHLDKKVLNQRAGDAQQPVPTTLANSDTASRSGDVDGSAKKVQSIPITVNRDGTLSPQAAAQAPPPANSGVPGLVIDGFGPPPASPGGPQLRGASGPGSSGVAPRAIPPPPAPPKVVSQVPPKVADLPLPKVIQPSPPAAAEPKGPPKATARLPVPKKAGPVRDDLLVQQGGSQAGTAASEGAAAQRKGSVVATGASGYVAVLASKKSRQDALNSFADLHQQYPDLLGGMTPDVREANLAEKGLWYRLIVGPPGSQQAARTLCGKLKERGMKDCWPVAY